MNSTVSFSILGETPHLKLLQMWKNYNRMMVRHHIINQYVFKWVNRVIFKFRTKRLSYDLTQTVTQPETTLSRK